MAAIVVAFDVRRMLSQAGVGAILLWAAWARWSYLSEYPEPYGVDGYYYAVQVRSLLAGDGLYFPGRPLTFWLLAPFGWLLDPIRGVKLGAALVTSLAAAPASWVVWRLTRSAGATVLAAVLVAVSGHSWLLAAEFVKQGFGVTLSLVVLAVLVVPQRTGWRAVGLSVLIAACYLTHKTAFALAVLFVAPVAVRELDHRRRRFALAGLAVAAACAAVIAVRRDVHLIAGMFHATAAPPFDLDPLRVEALVAGLASVAVLALAWLRRRRSSGGADQGGVHDVGAGGSERDVTVLVPAALFGVLLMNPWLNAQDPMGLGIRLVGMGIVTLAVCLPITLEVVLSAWWRRRAIVDGTLLMLCVILLVTIPTPPDDPLRLPPIELVDGFRALRGQVDPESVIVTADNRTAFMVTWFLGVEGRSRAPSEDDQRRRLRLLRAAEVAPVVEELRQFESELDDELVPPLHPVAGRRYALTLMEEATWNAFQARLGAVD